MLATQRTTRANGARSNTPANATFPARQHGSRIIYPVDKITPTLSQKLTIPLVSCGAHRACSWQRWLPRTWPLCWRPLGMA